MEKDRRYTHVKSLIERGYISAFKEIFDVVPKTVVARDLGMNNVRFSRLIDNVKLFMLGDIMRIAKLFEVDEKVFVDLVFQQYCDQKLKK